LSEAFSNEVELYTERVGKALDAALPAVDAVPTRLHEAMRYSVMNGGKRVRPLLVYATGECLQLDADKLDPIAVAIELIHAFSLVHDDLPAMDNDDLRRGNPTVHRAFDEATAILAADALQPLAFGVIAESAFLSANQKATIIGIVAAAAGSQGMTGGQSIDLASEGKTLTFDGLELMHSLKTGALLSACVAACIAAADNIVEVEAAALETFADNIGLAFQIRDDILDVEGETEVIGKVAGADENMAKATWPAHFGLEESRVRCDQLLAAGLEALAIFGERADSLRWLANYIVARQM
jgi:farnesyl diphosphate synthase